MRSINLLKMGTEIANGESKHEIDSKILAEAHPLSESKHEIADYLVGVVIPNEQQKCLIYWAAFGTFTIAEMMRTSKIKNMLLLPYLICINFLVVCCCFMFASVCYCC